MVCKEQENIVGDHLCRLRFSAKSFAQDWRHCDQLSNYVSKVISYSKANPFVFSNLFSTVINEVLEAVFRNNSGNDLVTIDLYQSGDDSLIISSIPVDDVSRGFYENIVQKLKSGNPKNIYKELIQSDGDIPPETGFYELAADYDANIEIEGKSGQDQIELSVRVFLEKENKDEK